MPETARARGDKLRYVAPSGRLLKRLIGSTRKRFFCRMAR